MALSCKNTGNGGGTQIAPGVYVDAGKIADVGVLTGEQPNGFKRTIEIGVKLYLDKGLDFQPEINVFGDFKRNSAGQVIGWGGAFPVRDLLSRVAGFNGDIDEQTKKIPDAVLRELLGKDIQTIRYVYDLKEGKLKYTTMMAVFPASTSVEEITKYWNDQRKKGYPKDYNPALVENGAGAGNAAPGTYNTAAQPAAAAVGTGW